MWVLEDECTKALASARVNRSNFVRESSVEMVAARASSRVAQGCDTNQNKITPRTNKWRGGQKQKRTRPSTSEEAPTTQRAPMKRRTPPRGRGAAPSSGRRAGRRTRRSAPLSFERGCCRGGMWSPGTAAATAWGGPAKGKVGVGESPKTLLHPKSC